jgi:hypothetical protein
VPAAIAGKHLFNASQFAQRRFEAPETAAAQGDGFQFAKLLIFHSLSFLVASQSLTKQPKTL